MGLARRARQRLEGPPGVNLLQCVCRATRWGPFAQVQSASTDRDGANRRLIHVALTTFHISAAKRYL